MKTSVRPCKNPNCKELIPSESRKLYHSNACKMRDYRRQNPVNKRATQTYIRYCKCCGQKFVTHHPSRVFDSNSCRVNYWQQQNRLKAKADRDE